MAISIGVSFYAWKNPAVLAGFMMNPYRIRHDKQYYRFITSGFIHNDHVHLLFNMISLYFFGRATEQIFAGAFGAQSDLYFIGLYLIALVVSDLPTYFKHWNNVYYNSLGASGAVSAVIFAFILFEPLETIHIYFIPIKGFILGILFVIFSYYQGKRSSDNINHDAHLYGGLFGLLFCIVLYPESVPSFFEKISAWRMFD